MKRPSAFLFAIYARSLGIYPRRLRARYQDQMLQAVRDGHAESRHPLLFWPYLFVDLLQSSIQEHVHMRFECTRRHPILLHAITLGVVLTCLGGVAAVSMQQMLRRGANHPQIETGRRLAEAVASGTKPQDLLPAERIDLRTSLEPFAIFYGEDRAPVSSDAVLDDIVPIPPAGVFANAQKNRIAMVTWQPKPGVRVAAVVRRLQGPQAGYVLTGRSLLLIEQQESALRTGTFVTWFLLMSLIGFGAVFLGRAQSFGGSGRPIEA